MLNKTNEVPALLEFAVQLESYELNKYVTNLLSGRGVASVLLLFSGLFMLWRWISE